jgi:hypothetical protein
MIDESLITEYDGNNFTISKKDWVIDTDGNTQKVSVIQYKNRVTAGGAENWEPCLSAYFNDCEECTANTCFDNITYGDVLVISLGLGLIPEYIQRNKNYTSIDVIEEDQQLIDHVDWLHNDINVIKVDDFETYQASKKYDLIIIECYGDRSEFNSSGTMRVNYTPQLKDADSIIICPFINLTYRNA